jgi:fatty acid desaturase
MTSGLSAGLGTRHSPPARDRAYRRGYQAPAELRAAIGGAHRTRLRVTVLVALLDHLGIFLLAVGAAGALRWHAALAVPAVPLAGLLIGKQLRALECLVHEASHFNWSRHRRRLNDVLAELLAGVATGIRIGRYRESHLVHHSRLGTDDDPDLRRYRELDVEGLQRDSRTAYLRGVCARLIIYQRGWLRTSTADPVSLAMPVLWAVTLNAAPVFLLWGTSAALTAAGAWAFGYAVALPVIRFIGESSEHSYSDADTVIGSTVSNLGPLQRWFIHPHNDGFHTVHHLWPGTPHYHLRNLHSALLATDPDGYATRLRFRTSVRSDPSTGVPAGRGE